MTFPSSKLSLYVFFFFFLSAEVGNFNLIQLTSISLCDVYFL